jgi:tetratricopeptide (TPR) repeat protein
MPPSRCEPPVPPKIRIPQSGSLAFMYVLSEFESLGLENEGLWLWQALRRVRDWNGEPPEESDAATSTYLEVDPALRPSLAALERLLRDPEPDDDTLEAVAFCCFNAAMWADERGAYRTAVGLLHAAEDIYPDNPHYAYNLGRIARKLALYDESEAWLKWAHYVARSTGKWEVATLALSGLGNLHRQRGNLPKARRFHEVTRRMAKLRGLRTLEGDSLYDLAVMSFSFGDERQGVEYARTALDAYGPGHVQIYHLAKDVAWFWMDHYGNFESAARVLMALTEHVWNPAYRVLLLANLGRAASGAGWVELFEAMWIETWALVRQQVSRQGHAAALVQLAQGAGNLGQWERSGFAAAEALSIARERKEAEVLLAAEAIVEALGHGVIRDEAVGNVFKDRARMTPARAFQEVDELTIRFAEALRARRDNAPESPTRALVYPGAD